MPAQAQWLATRLRRHIAELIRLASPVVVTRAGILTMATADAAMLGRSTVEQVAFQRGSREPVLQSVIQTMPLIPRRRR